MKIVIKDDEVFLKAHKVYERFTQDDLLRHLYESRMEAEWSHKTDLLLAEEKGMEEGIEKGKAEGLSEGMEKTARAMLLEGLDINIIKKVTGLSEGEIEKLRGKN